MVEGYIKLFRKFKDWEWYSDTNTKNLFLHCLLSANHKTNKWRGITVEQGSFITSYGKLAEQLKISKRSVRTAIKHLKSTQEVTIKTTNKYTIVHIVNWALYQSNEITTDTQSDTVNDIQPTRKRHASDTQVPTNKNEKNEKNDKNEKKEDIKDTNVSMSVSTDSEQSTRIDWDGLKDYWNENSLVNSIRSINESRKKHLRARIKKHGIDSVKEVIDNIATSKFLQGHNSRNWMATFDWVFKNPTNFLKVLEGNYNDEDRINNKNNGDYNERLENLQRAEAAMNGGRN